MHRCLGEVLSNKICIFDFSEEYILIQPKNYIKNTSFLRFALKIQNIMCNNAFHYDTSCTSSTSMVQAFDYFVLPRSTYSL